MDCHFSRKAEEDLESIADYIASDNPRRALSYISELRTRCHSLVTFPEAAVLKPEFGEGIRMTPFGRYLIFYTVQATCVRVERILAGERLLSNHDFTA